MERRTDYINSYYLGEMDEFSVTEDFSVTAADGKNYHTKHYNLDAIIAVGYRVNKKRMENPPCNAQWKKIVHYSNQP